METIWKAIKVFVAVTPVVCYTLNFFVLVGDDVYEASMSLVIAGLLLAAGHYALYEGDEEGGEEDAEEDI